MDAAAQPEPPHNGCCAQPGAQLTHHNSAPAGIHRPTQQPEGRPAKSNTSTHCRAKQCSNLNQHLWSQTSTSGRSWRGAATQPSTTSSSGKERDTWMPTTSPHWTCRWRRGHCRIRGSLGHLVQPCQTAEAAGGEGMMQTAGLRRGQIPRASGPGSPFPSRWDTPASAPSSLPPIWTRGPAAYHPLPFKSGTPPQHSKTSGTCLNSPQRSAQPCQSPPQSLDAQSVSARGPDRQLAADRPQRQQGRLEAGGLQGQQQLQDDYHLTGRGARVNPTPTSNNSHAK